MSNLKVHFAGLEGLDFCNLAKKAEIKYGLMTIFPYIAKNFGIKAYSPNATDESFSFHNENFKHSICDSGLFTLMFGAHAGARDKLFLEKWLFDYTEYIKKVGYKGACVEVDCQKILGVEEAWYFRRKMRDMLPDNEIINVFHLEDGVQGFKRLVEFSSYIAISVPELRIHRPKSYKKIVFNLATKAKAMKPNIKIHLLGCTESSLLKSCNFCYSSDSTSWMAGCRYGEMKTVSAKTSRRQYQNNDFSEINEYMKERGYILKKSMDLYYIHYIQMRACLKAYTECSGSQK